MKWLKYLWRSALVVLVLPLLYLLISLALTAWPTGKVSSCRDADPVMFLTTNGVHLDLVMAVDAISDSLKEDLVIHPGDRFLAFGWGDQEFYLNTPEWSDLKASTAFNALFAKGPSLVHVTRYQHKQAHWNPVHACPEAIAVVNSYISHSFLPDLEGHKTLLKNKGYGTSDEFYRARGSYSCFKTCNSWVNSALQLAGLRASIWTPFDFGLMRRYDPGKSKSGGDS